MTALLEEIIEAIRDKKGFDISIMDMRELKHAVADYFVICSGNSDTQVGAISENVEGRIKKNLKERPWHVEGERKGDWVLIDFVNIVVHVMLPVAREFYGIEDLWGDAKVTHYAE